MKKIIALILVLLLCGCTADFTEESKSAETAAEAAEGSTNLSNDKQGWGFRKIQGGRPEFTAKQRNEMERFSCIYEGADGDKSIYLTFDEGYENGYTEPILDVLQAHGVHAAFFITGPYMKEHADIVDKMVEGGHTVGNHTVNHPSLPDKTGNDIKAEIEGLDNMFFERYGTHMKYLRPPMGEYSERTLDITKNMGYTNVFWSFAYRDWERDNQKGAEYALSQFKSGLHDGAVILLHAVSKDNAAALGDMIKYAGDCGYEFKTLDEYRFEKVTY